MTSAACSVAPELKRKEVALALRDASGKIVPSLPWADQLYLITERVQTKGEDQDEFPSI